MIEWVILFNNLIYAGCGVVLALVFMLLGYKMFDLLTPFNTGKELDDENVAIGIVIGSIFIGVGMAVGLVVGLSLI